MSKTHTNKKNRNIQQQEQHMSQSSFDSQSEGSQSEQRSFQDQDGNQEQMNGSQESCELRRKKQELLELEERRIKDQLKEIPFGELLRYKNLKEQVAKSTATKQIKKDRSKKQLPDEKKDKNAPRQIKIMRRPPKSKPKIIFASQRPKSIDPRFQSYAGSYNQDLATKSYSFIQDIRNNEIDYIKKQLKSKKLRDQNKEVLLKNYNKITSDMKKFEHQQIEKKVKSGLKGEKFNPKKKLIKEHVQRAKLNAIDDKSQDRRLKKKEKKIQKQKFIEKKQFMNSRK